MPENPPRFAEAILRWLVGGRDADAVAGDLRESFAVRGGGTFWYCREAASCLAVRLSLRLPRVRHGHLLTYREL